MARGRAGPVSAWCGPSAGENADVGGYLCLLLLLLVLLGVVQLSVLLKRGSRRAEVRRALPHHDARKLSIFPSKFRQYMYELDSSTRAYKCGRGRVGCLEAPC